MLSPRQDDATTGFGPGPISIQPPGPSLPLSISPISTGPPTTVVSLPQTTFTVTLGSKPIPSPSSSGFLTSSVLTSTPSTPSVPSSSSTPAASSVSTAPSPTPSGPADSPSINFAPISNATTCTPLQIQWQVSNPTSTNLSTMSIDLSVTSVGTSDVNMSIATAQPVLNDPLGWNVIVPPGQYAINGRWTDGHGAAVQSSVFTVQGGSNTTCISGAPINTAKTTNKGAIAGGTVGGLLLLTCAGIALFFLWGVRSRSTKRTHGPRRGWGGLGSLDSKSRTRGDSNDHLGAVSARDAAKSVDSDGSLDAEKVGVSPTMPTLMHHTPTVELARLPSSRPTLADSPRSSLDLPADPFTGPPSRRASRTPRKPVPAYAPTPEELEAMAMARTRSDQSYARSSVSASVADSAAQHHPSTSSASHELRSKSSGLFDGQPVHYLIPDMPPPQPPQ